MDTGSKLSLQAAVESAQRADTIVYSILFSDEDSYNQGFGGWGGRGRRGGSGRFPVPEHADGKAGSGYHKIHLAIGQKELTVQAREGYYAER